MLAVLIIRNTTGKIRGVKCKECGTNLGLGGKRGRTPRYCSNACRQRAYRRRKHEGRIPPRLTALARWTRADDKRPITPDGSAASSTNPATWTTHRAVSTGAGNGFGFMLGDGVVCIDLDHALTEEGPTSTAAAVLEATPGAWAEISTSGTGLHIFGAGFERAGRKFTAADGTGVEIYARARFIRMTGKTYRPGGLVVLDLDAVMDAARR